jgi:uncharacterized protein YlaI
MKKMTKKTRKKLNASGKQPCPICDEKEILVEHHIEGRKIPNANHPSNLSYICSNCHRKIHEGIIILEGYFMTTSGKTLLWHYNEEESVTGEEKKTHIIERKEK